MAYRMYNALPCAYCGKDQGLIDGSGRERVYCSPACKQRAYRERKAKTTRAALRNDQLEQRWYLASITGELREQLYKLYLAHGEAAANQATDAVLLACQQVRQALRQR